MRKQKSNSNIYIIYEAMQARACIYIYINRTERKIDLYIC